MAPSPTERVTRVEERVDNHIKFFWVVVSFGFLWLGALSKLVWDTKSAVHEVAKAGANSTAQIVASLLSSPDSTPIQVEKNLAAVSSILKATKIGAVRPDTAKLKSISDKLADVETQYPQLPQVWETTGAFISYKSQALLAPGSKTLANASGKPCGILSFAPSKPVIFRDCEYSLEEVANQFSGTTYNGQPLSIIFVNCIVHYRGGKIPDGNVHFYGTIFVFDVPVVPPANAVQVMRELAQANSFDGVSIKG